MVDLYTPQTLVDLFLHSAANDPDAIAVLVPHEGEFTPVSWQQLRDEVLDVACGFRSLGVRPGDRVVQVSDNRREWIVCDLAIAVASAVHVPLHASLSGEQIARQIRDSNPCVVVLEGQSQWDKLLAIQPNDLDNVTTVMVDSGFHVETQGDRRVVSWESLRSRGDAADRPATEEAARNDLTAETLATILYTSGTTGDAKGVMLSHGNLVSNACGMLAALDMRADDLRLSILPWSHVFARTCDLYTWLATGCTLAIGEGREQVLANCAALKPTLLNGVPYFYEKIHAGLTSAGADEMPGALQAMLGGRIRLCCSGGAALPEHVTRLFKRQGVSLLQGYGLTETSPVITMETLDENKIGCVGKPIRDVEVRIADDGEILTRGPHVMQGYYKNRQATDDVLRDGWFYTGDLGQLDEQCFLRITGRKSEMIVLATGKNVAPVNIESLLVQSPLIRQVIVVGNDRKFLGALIVPDPGALRAEIDRLGIVVESTQQALAHPDVLERMARCIADRLASLSATEQVGTFRLLEDEFTVATGALTPSLKMCRPRIASRYSELIETMYQA